MSAGTGRPRRHLQRQPRTGVRALLLLLVLLGAGWARAADPLPSWNEGAARQRIMGFVHSVTEPGGKDFVPPAERIAVFDNDGTLWAEQPMYVQLAFAIDRARTLTAARPELMESPVIKAAATGDLRTLAASGEHGLLELVATTHAGNTPEEFAQIVRDWIGAARHPRFHRPHTELAYRPMLELLAWLRANGFRIWIVSGGGVEFLRAIAGPLYGVEPEQVIGSSIRTKYELRDGKPTIVRLPEIDFIDDKAGKPLAIQKSIGRRPLLAFGNSDGDFEMLEWTTAASGPRLGVLLHHDDAAREYAYDRASSFGKLARGLDEATRRGWLVVGMRNDWNAVFDAAHTP
jgi:phosphoserine phosphatase